MRLRSAVKHFPTLVLIFSGLAALALFAKGHAIIKVLQDYIPLRVSEGTLTASALGVIVIVTAAVLVIFLRQECRECECQDCLYCPKCDAVDKYDSGCCPVCQTLLTERASFYFTTYKDEQEIIERWGLRPCREA